MLLTLSDLHLSVGTATAGVAITGGDITVGAISETGGALRSWIALKATGVRLFLDGTQAVADRRQQAGGEQPARGELLRLLLQWRVHQVVPAGDITH